MINYYALHYFIYDDQKIENERKGKVNFDKRNIIESIFLLILKKKLINFIAKMNNLILNSDSFLNESKLSQKTKNSAERDFKE